MANRLLLQTLVKFRDEIKSGSAKVQDVVTDYFNSTGKQPTADERSIILNEFNEFAPSNIEDLSVIRTENLRTSPDGEGIMSKYKSTDLPAAEQDAMMEKFLQGADRIYAKFVDDALVDLQNASPSEQKEMIKAIIGRKGMFKYLEEADAKKLLNSVDKPAVGTVSPLRGDESFDELLEREITPEFVSKIGKNIKESKAEALKEKAKTGMPEFDEILDAEFKKAFGKKESKEGLGSLYPKGGLSEEIKRDDLAGFMKAMRGAGIKNEDVMDVAKITDVAEGKRAATTLARAADMGADTKIKQEFLSDLDETIMDKGPRFFQEEYHGYESFDALLKNKGIEVRNAIVDDLEALGVDEDKVSRILSYANDVARKNPNSPEAYLEAIKQDLEMSNIKYDLSFWENYLNKILELSSKGQPRFAGGGLV